MRRDALAIRPDVADALEHGRPVVALESTLISHGLPAPHNLDVALAAETAIRAAGAVPATVAIHDGRILVGLTEDDIVALARAPAGTVRKTSRPSFGFSLAAGGWAATTVSATMLAADAAGIRVFATGGIGGVHRGAIDGPASLDISTDLVELSRTPVAVVCAGPKSILDVPRTLELLETLGVPLVTIGQDELPGFTSRGSGVRSPTSVADVGAAADVARAHFGLGLGSGILFCTPVPEADALPADLARQAVAQASAEAEAAGVEGPAVTPWLLGRIAELTAGASVRANVALIVEDARVGAELAVALAAGR